VTADNGVLANDSDPDGATLTAVVESQPSYGSMQLNSDGSFTYTPNGSFTGSDSFTYEAYNDTAYSAVATVMLTSGPVATAQQYSVTHDQTLSVDAADGLLDGANDADGDTLTAALATGASDGNVMVNSDGSFTYTPYLHFVGTDSFTYTVSDGTNTSAPATVTIDVADDAPIVGDDNYSVHANTTLTVAAPGLMNMASDEDDFLPSSFILESGPSYGTFNFKPDGTFVYTPNTNFVGTDTFTYEGYDGALYSNIGTVTITVYDQAPFATPDSYNVAENGSLNGTQASVLQNDYDPDGDPLTAVLMSGPSDAASFVLNADGTFK
jgi:VCBS repeat-containing protein